MLTPNQKRNFTKILSFGLIWFFFGLLYAQLEYGLLGNSSVYPSTNNPYRPGSSFYFIAAGSLIMGILIGSIETLIMNRFYTTKSFIKRLLLKTSLYLVSISVIVLAIVLFATSSRLELSLIDPIVLTALLRYASDFSFISIVIYTAVIALLSLFIVETSNYLGLTAITNFFTGKHYLPHEEERIFMFLDMKSSTSIAEELGNMDFFQLLSKFYEDATDAIVQTSGMVYQYAGDEIIISWNLQDGLANRNCIRCFFLIKDKFQKLSYSYLNKFNLVPEFKAGLHCGKVTMGEVGTLKKEILFSGDVLNTTSRIQSCCNDYLADILISTDLLSKLDIGDAYELDAIGKCKLKGRKQRIGLYSLCLKK